MKRGIQNMLFLIALLGILQIVTSQQILVSSYIQAKAQNVVNVPKEQLSQLKSISLEGWIRPSQTMDYPYPSSVIRKSFSTIMGSSTSKTGWGDNIKGVDSFINLYSNRWQDKAGFILAFENGKDFQYIYNDLQYTNYFGRWYFIYGAYLSDVQKHYLVTYSAFDDTWQDSISPIVKKNPIIDFYQFSVNSEDVKKSVQFNGYISDPAFKFLASDNFYNSIEGVKQYLSQKVSKPRHIGVLNKTVFTFIGQSTTIPAGGLYESFANYQGADEYSINGQAQLTGSFATSGNTLLFRLGTNNPETLKTSYEEGDAALMVYIQNGKKTCFQTYRIDLPDSSHVSQCFSAVPKKGEWFYFYQGYSRKLGRIFNYIRISGVNYSAPNTDVLHVDPNAFYLYVGQDPINKQWAGSFQGLNIEFGPGAYRTDLITDFPPINNKSVKEQVVIPKTYVEPSILQSKASQTLAIDAKIISQAHIRSVKEYAIHFWFRRDLITPELVDFSAAKGAQSVAGVTERDDYTSTQEFGDAALSIQYQDHSKSKQPGFIFTTYNDQGSAKTKSVTINYETKYDQGQWIWVYFAYSQPLQQASIYVELPDGQKFVQQINSVSHSQANNLKALIGKSGDLNPVSGQFYDAQFVYYDGCYQSSTATIEQYKTQYVNKPPQTQPKAGVYNPFGRKFFSSKQPPSKTPYVYKTEGAGALSYGLGAWALWNKAAYKSSIGNLLFTLSIYDKTSIGKTYTKLGSRVLQVFYKKKYIYFATYSYAHLKSQDSNPILQKIYVPKKDRLSWCYFYFGYSHLDQQAIGSISCQAGFKHQFKFDKINHIIPTELTLQVARDGILTIWRGEIYQPSLIIGSPLASDFKYDQTFYPSDPTLNPQYDKDNGIEEPLGDGEDDGGKGSLPPEEDDSEEEDDDPTDPTDPTNPSNEPANPTNPTEPTNPTNPTDPTNPSNEPANPTNPTEPTDPTNSTEPTNPTDPAVNPLPQPEQPQCATIYSECGYVDRIQEVCQNIPSIQISEIRSIQIPDGKTLKFFQQENYKGINVKFLQSVECIELGLREDPNIQWGDFVELFNSGKIGFIDSEGNDIELYQAKRVFFKSNLRKQNKSKHFSK